MPRIFSIIALLTVFLPVAGSAWELKAEGGAAWTGYNFFRIPGDTGTRVDLPEEGARLAGRLTAEIHWGERNAFRLLAAPFTAGYEFRSSKNIQFAGKAFTAGTDLDAVYRFNSYRASYIRDLSNGGPWHFRLGFTAKVREAFIDLRGGGQKARKSNTGFVPLIYLQSRYDFSDAWSVQLEADALGAPQGRAVDALVEVSRSWRTGTRIGIGYRVLEGGVDNDEVFNFALIRFAVLTLTQSF